MKKVSFFESFALAIDKSLPADKHEKAYYDVIRYGLFGEVSSDPVISALCNAWELSINKYSELGGARPGAGAKKGNIPWNSPKKSESTESTDSLSNQSNQPNHPFKKSESELESEKEIRIRKVDSLIGKIGNVNVCDRLMIDDNFIIDYSDPWFSPYSKFPTKLKMDIQNWIRKTFNGKDVSKKLICEQFTKFATRQGIMSKVLKEC